MSDDRARRRVRQPGWTLPWRRRWFERVARRVYAGDWPARLWARLPTAPVVAHHWRIALPELDRPLRIGFASDLHFGPTTSRHTLEQARALLAAARPDVLLLGGDYVFLGANPRRMAALTAWVAGIPAKARYAVIGNHDLWTDHRAIARALEAGGARLLVNEAATLPAPFDRVAVLGLDESWFGDADPEGTAAQVPDAAVKIGLVHSPDGYPLLRRVGARVVLTGHTHGGQICLPNGHPMWVPSAMGQDHPHGLHPIGDGWLLVSRGVGTVEIPVRTWAPPDVILLDLVPGSAV